MTSLQKNNFSNSPARRGPAGASAPTSKHPPSTPPQTPPLGFQRNEALSSAASRVKEGARTRTNEDIKILLENNLHRRPEQVRLPPDTSIEELRAVAASKLKIPRHLITLRHKGMLLRTGTLTSSNVASDSTVWVRSSKLLGGSQNLANQNQVLPDVSPAFSELV